MPGTVPSGWPGGPFTVAYLGRHFNVTPPFAYDPVFWGFSFLPLVHGHSCHGPDVPSLSAGASL